MKHFLLSTLLTLACTRKVDTSKKEIYLVSPAKIASLDPVQISDVYSGDEAGKVYESLYEFHPLKRPYELVPNLAEGMPEVSADGLSYKIKLKSGVLFHDDKCFPDGKGREVKIDDVIYSLKRLADPKNQARGWWVLDEKIKGLNEWREKYSKADATNYDEAIEGLHKIDDYTLEFKLNKPYPQLLYGMAMPSTSVVAKEAVQKYGQEFLNHPVGTGAFVLKSLDQTNRMVYEKNPTFREKLYPSEGAPGDKEKGLLEDAGKRLPLVDKIIVDVIVETQPVWLAFQKAKSDLILLPKDSFEQALDKNRQVIPSLSSKGVNLVSDAMIDVGYYAFNHLNPIFKNKKLRQAMMLAYDRDESNRIFYNNTALKAEGPIPPGLGGYNANFKNPYGTFDVERAKKLLAEAGHPNGKGLPEITVENLNDTVARQQIEFFTKCMARIGIRIKGGTNTWPELVRKVTKAQHQMYTMAWSADYPDAENFLSLLYCPNKAPGSNGSNYCNPEFDRLYREAVILQDGPERSALYEKINALAAEELPWLFGFHRTRFYLTQGWLKNFKYMEFHHSQFQYLNVDLDKKKELVKKF
jgi:oligopeptide transport system substrate-binding protein